MVTENVNIVIKERGAKSTSRAIKGVGLSASKAKIAVAGLIGALGGFLAVRGLARIAKDAIRTAASFETMGVQLRALLGSQTEANKALDTFTQLASKTPFSVQQVIAGATALGAAAIGNREKLEELTRTAANLAAVTGLSFREAAGNLQRALSGGIAAADLFRERGVKALIESIASIPDATKLSTKELEQAFATVFGRGGVFGRAAEDLSNTLGGALSNIGDAATNTQAALGNAFAPSVINAARQVLIPFLVSLQRLIEQNKDAIADFAAALIQGAIPALTNTARAAFAVIQAYQQLVQAARLIIGTYQQITLSVNEALVALVRFGNTVGFVDDKVLAIAEGALALVRKSVDDYVDKVVEAEAENAAFAKTLDALREKLDELERGIAGIDFTRRPGTAPPDIDLPEGEKIDAAVLARQESAAKRVLALTNALRLSSAARVSQEEAAIERLEQQRTQLLDQAKLAGDITLAREGLAEIEAQLLDIRAQQAVKALEESQAFARAIGMTIGDRVGEGIRGAFLGEGIDAMDIMANIGADLVQNALDDAIQAISDSIADVFSGLAESFGADLGGAFGSAIAGAIGVGIGILAAELSGTSARANNNLVREATESAAATRGVVAGPTSIPVFQVGAQLEDALTTTNGILIDILAALQLAPSAAATTGAATEADGAAADLSLTTPALA